MAAAVCDAKAEAALVAAAVTEASIVLAEVAAELALVAAEAALVAAAVWLTNALDAIDHIDPFITIFDEGN